MPEELQAAFGLAVREVRRSHGWSQEQLAELAGLDRTYVSGLERGRRTPALSTQERLATALEVDLATLLRKAQDLR